MLFSHKILAIASLAFSASAQTSLAQAQMDAPGFGFTDIHDLIEYVQNYRDAHPEKTWNEIDHDLFFSQRTRLRERADDYDYAAVIGYLNSSDYEIFKNRLNFTGSERALFNRSPSRGVMTIALGYTAFTAAESNYTSGFLNGNADAFRHCHWNALMTVNIDPQWTADWTNAHEDYPENPSLEKSMDLTNNLNGQQIGAARPDAYPFQLENACLAAANVGRLTRIAGGSLVPSNAEGRK